MLGRKQLNVESERAEISENWECLRRGCFCVCPCMCVCVLQSVFQFEIFSISVNLCNYIPTEGGIKPISIYWGDEYDSPLLYRLHICRQTRINLRQ